MYEQEKCKFLKSHEWAFVDGDIAVVGISDHAQHEISDIVFVELPQIGAQVKAGERCCVVESVKSASDIFSPVSGEVTEINDSVLADPSVVNREPHAGGWLFKVKMSDANEVQNLLSFEDYKASL